MTKPMNYRLKFIVPALAVLTLSACGSSGNRYEVPEYASMYNADSYRVICTGAVRKEIYVRYYAMDGFYHPDGSLKSRDEFCQENALGAGQR
jgi:hypothetical protein